jgi:hypothetical protein
VRSSYLVAKLLRNLASLIERMDEKELEDFLRTPHLRLGQKTERMQQPKGIARVRQGKINTEHLMTILKELEQANSRQRGLEILELHTLSKVELSRLAKLRDIHTTKDDNLARLKEKLVESLIGSRLGSLAIRGN